MADLAERPAAELAAHGRASPRRGKCRSGRRDNLSACAGAVRARSWACAPIAPMAGSKSRCISPRPPAWQPPWRASASCSISWSGGRLDGGRTLAALTGLIRNLRTPAIACRARHRAFASTPGAARAPPSSNGPRGSPGSRASLADLLTFACIAAFIVVLAMALARAVRPASRRYRPKPDSEIPRGADTTVRARVSRVPPRCRGRCCRFLIAGPPQRYAVDTATQILIYIMLGWGLNVVVGLAGLLDLGYVAFYAVGAYTYALISTDFGWSFWVCLPLAGCFAALWGITLGFPVLAPARRLPRHRDAGFRRDHPHRPHQLAEPHRRPERRQPHPAADLFRPALRQRRVDPTFHGFFGTGVQPHPPPHLPLLRHPGAGAPHELRDAAPAAACPSGGPGRPCARTRSPAARSASTRSPRSSPRSPSAPCSAASPARSSPRGRASSAPNPSHSGNPRSCSPLWCLAASAASSAS